MNSKTSAEIFLTVNNREYKVGPEIPPTMSLVSFIREIVGLKGTKASCYEGGCGICTVMVTLPVDRATGKVQSYNAPSCQIPVYACAGASIQTIEDLGNREDGLSPLQKSLVRFYGTQCGYCSPAMIMTIHSQIVNCDSLTMEDMERALDGNLCRCTGYRPILDAFKSFASDAPQELKQKIADIEDSYKKQCFKSGSISCGGLCKGKDGDCRTIDKGLTETIRIDFHDKKWYRPISLKEIFEILDGSESKRVKIVCGNTSAGVFKKDGPYDIFIHTAGVRELYSLEEKAPRGFGACHSLSKCIEMMNGMAKMSKEYKHLEEVAQHWNVVANTGLRNIASWAGNLMMKHSHPEFSSDIWLTLAACEAKIKIGDSSSSKELDLEEFLQADMSKSLILSLILPPKDNFKIRTFKVMPRATNSKAYLMAAFTFQMDPIDEFRVVSKPNILFGGISPHCVRASECEKLFEGISLKDKDRVLSIIRKLTNELMPDAKALDSSPHFRVSLAQAFLYKTILGILGDSCPASVQSGGLDLKRPVSSGRQSYDANEDTWPIGQAIPKVESDIQVTGEAEYLDDMPSIPGELHGVFVQSRYAKAKIRSIDASECLKIPGVVHFITAEDIPGVNSFVYDKVITDLKPDPVFASSEVIYAGQPIGLVLGEHIGAALKGAAMVVIDYEDIQHPVLTIQDSIKANRVINQINLINYQMEDIVIGDPEGSLSSSKHVIEGELNQGSQFHFAMEPFTARALPTDEGYDVFCTSQKPTEMQRVVAANLNLSTNSINISVKRIGGGFGGKITRANIVGSAAAIAAHKVRKPVRVKLDLTTTMTISGWRESFYSQYKVGFNDEGLIEAIHAKMISDVGHCGNEGSSCYGIIGLQNVYHCPNWRVENADAHTDTAANTYCRSPGVIDAIATVETIIEHIAVDLKKDPIDIRKMNFFTQERPPTLLPTTEDNLVKYKIFPLLEETSNFAQRQRHVEEFNKKNRWQKRGLSAIPTQYFIDYYPFHIFNVHIVIYENDGTIAITHGGIEMGQGINTKVIQVAAKCLGVPIDLIRVKATNSFTGANSGSSEASITSDLNAHGALLCCEELKKRMDPVAVKMQNENGGGKPSWVDLVRRCREEQIDLCQRIMTYPKSNPKGYDVWAAACIEVELDVLTGQHLVLRADIIEDCGRSLNPCVDVGQVEGAFVMGQGFYTTEKLKFDPVTGQKLSVGTQEYKPPTALDIPVDFRVTFLPGGDNNFGVVRSKATGEPAICLSYGIVTALRQAIRSAREDAGHHGWFQMDTPVTPEVIHQLCLIDPKQFIL